MSNFFISAPRIRYRHNHDQRHTAAPPGDREHQHHRGEHQRERGTASQRRVFALITCHLLLGYPRDLAPGLRSCLPWAGQWEGLHCGRVRPPTGAGHCPWPWRGNQMARWFAVAVLALNAIDMMFFIPAYPFRALTIIAMDVVALWGLCA